MSKLSIKNQLNTVAGDSLQNIEAILTSDKVKTLASGALIIVGGAGLIGLSLVAPKTLQMLTSLMRRRTSRPLRIAEQKAKLLRTFYYLKETGQIKIEEQENGLFARLTNKGVYRVKKVAGVVTGINRPAAWDGSWWLVAADIPTRKHRIGADMLRVKLRELNLFSLQRTLWLYPFDIRSEIEDIVHYYNIEKFVTMMHVAKLDKQDRKVAMVFFKQRNIL